MLGEMRWPDLAGESRILVLPVGSCEQHGPHLPLDTDTLLASAWARALAERRSDVVVAPALGLGASGEHQSFPGTLSVGTPALTRLLVEVARSALPQPLAATPGAFSCVLFLNAHGGNADALAAAVKLLRSESRAVCSWQPIASAGDLHAGATETSLMLHLYPERVRMDLAQPATPPGPLSGRIDAERSGDATAEVLRRDGVAALSTNGVLGDPSGADAARGEVLFDTLLADLEASLHALTSEVVSATPGARPHTG